MSIEKTVANDAFEIQSLALIFAKRYDAKSLKKISPNDDQSDVLGSDKKTIRR